MKMLSPFYDDESWPRRRMASDLFDDFFNDFDRVVNSFGRLRSGQPDMFNPSCDIHESENHFLISLDMPGVKKEDINIEVKDNQLRISGERRRDVESEQNERSHRHERTYGRFERMFTVPRNIDASNIEAEYDNGVLNIALPKAEESKGKNIEIQSGKSSLINKLLGSRKKERSTDVKGIQAS